MAANAEYGSVRGAIGYFVMNQSLLCDSDVKTIRITGAPEEVDVRFRLKNKGERPVRIVGCEANCGCLLPDDLPFELAPAEQRIVTFKVVTKSKEGTSRFGKPTLLNLELLTNNPEQSRLALHIKCDP
jgi:hypothetical protein